MVEGKALQLARGSIATPAFLPDATRGAVRGLDSADVAACGIQGLVVNAFHLQSKPGASVISALGGIHQFMRWDRPILSDSGGFQIFSLLSESPKLGSASEKGFIYRRERGDDRNILTPEKCVRIQFKLGSDIMVCLDHCTHPKAPAEEQRRSVEHTVSWARACRREFDRLCEETGDRPLLFAPIQGGNDEALRRECAERLVEIGFDGYGFGGWPITKDGNLSEMVALVAELTPPEAPKWALGVGKPEHVVTAAFLGYDLFDCVLPTRDARHGRLYISGETWDTPATPGADFYEHLYIKDKKHVRDAAPIDRLCDCLTCRTYSRAYMRHLSAVGDALAARLATIHNLRFYTRLMERLACVGSRDEAR